MRILKFSAAFAAFCLSASAAGAADIGYNYGGEPAYAAPVVGDWSGFYLGAHLGYGFGSTDIADPDGVLGGVQVGGNWQFQQLVVGAEGDFSGAGIGTDAFDREFNVDWLATVRGRIGWAFDRFMVYGTGGVAWASTNYDDGSFDEDVSHMGWAAGAGVEAMITENISAKAEYLFMGLGEEDYSAEGPLDLDIHTIRLGVNYHF